MNDDLLVYYNSELSYIRRLGHEFARAHPDVAPRLRLDAESGQDPYVERLLEGFAYLTARVRKKLDDELPEIAEALLNVLYPHYLAPIPSASIVQFELDPGQAGLVNGYPIPRGTKLETEDVEGDACQFQTSQEVRLFPVRVSQAELAPVHRRPVPPLPTDAQTTLRIRLAAYGPDGPLSKLALDRLTFYLAGEPVHVNAVYEALFCDVLAVVLAESADDGAPVLLPEGCVQPVGFAPGEALLPFSPRTFPGYRLLTEYFALPEKFRFFEVVGLSEAVRKRFSKKAELVFYLGRRHENLQRSVRAEMFRLGCSPVVNLFEHRADPFRLTHRRSRYHLVPDVRRVQCMEVYSVDRVSASTPDGRTLSVLPFYGFNHSEPTQPGRAYWYASRRSSGNAEGRFDPGTEIDLAFVDLDFSPAAQADWTVEVTTTCLNRDLAARLPFGAQRPAIRMLQGGPLTPIRCLMPPTPTRRPLLREGTLWKLISHLALNHLSLTEGGRGADAIRELLSLYDVVRSAETTAKIQGIKSVESQRVTRRMRSGTAGGIGRGVEVAMEFDEQRYADNGLFPFASLLERFLPLYGSINSFTQFVARSNMRENGVVHRWPPRTSEKPLL